MPDTAIDKALKALDQAVDRTADELTVTIKALRQRRKAAMKAGDARQAATIGRKLAVYGHAMATLDRGKVRKLDSAPEIQKLIDGFKDATKDLKNARRQIKETKALIEKVTKVVQVVSKLAKKALV